MSHVGSYVRTDTSARVSVEVDGKKILSQLKGCERPLAALFHHLNQLTESPKIALRGVLRSQNRGSCLEDTYPPALTCPQSLSFVI